MFVNIFCLIIHEPTFIISCYRAILLIEIDPTLRQTKLLVIFKSYLICFNSSNLRAMEKNNFLKFLICKQIHYLFSYLSVKSKLGHKVVPLCTTMYHYVPVWYHYVPLCTTMYHYVPLWYHYGRVNSETKLKLMQSLKRWQKIWI